MSGEDWGHDDRGSAPPEIHAGEHAHGRAQAKLTNADDPEAASLPPEAFGRGSKKRGLLIGLAAIVTAGLAFGAFGYFQHRAAVRSAELAFGDLNMCLFGQAEVPSTEVAARFHTHQVAMLSRTVKERSEGASGGAWPERCGVYALRLADASDGAGYDADDGTSLLAKSTELAKLLKEKGLDGDLGAALEQTWKAAEAARVRPVKSVLAGPPEHGRALTVDDVPESALIVKDFVGLKQLQIPEQQNEVPAFFIDQKDVGGPFSCFVERERVLCQHVEPSLSKLSQPLTVIGTADPGAAPIVYVGNRADTTMYRSDTGVELGRGVPLAAYSRSDGASFIAYYDNGAGEIVLASHVKGDKEPKLVKLSDELRTFFGGDKDKDKDKEKDKAKEDDKLPRLEPLDLTLAHGFAYMRLSGVDMPSTLFVAKLKGDGHLDTPQKIAEDVGWNDYDSANVARIQTCRGTEGRRAVIIRSSDGDRVSFFLDGKWTPALRSGVGLRGNLVCHGNGLVAVNHGLVSTCSSAACDQQVVKESVRGSGDTGPRDSYSDTVLFGKAGDAPSAYFTVWAAKGQRAGIRAKRGLIPELGDTPDSVLFDDLLLNGKLTDLSTVSEFELVGGGDHALLIMQTKKGLAAIRVSPEGQATPENVVWQ
ncbi:MAG: hypothetical protein U0271_24460 [Polyangiaceae bacterium]